MSARVRDYAGCFGKSLIGVLFLVSFGTLVAYGQNQVPTSKQTNDKIFQLAQGKTAPSEIPVGPGDLIHVDVFDVPELTREVRVSDTGDISLPLIPGRIHVAGLTTFEVEAKVESLLVENGLVSHPQVTIFVKEQISQPVSIMGAVAKPMVMQIVRPTTILELLADAGGITDDAGAFIFITRGGLNAAPVPAATPPPKGGGADDEPAATEKIRLSDLLVSGDPTFNVQVFGGDIVSVPRSGLVYVLGSVMSPGGYVLESRGDRITVLRALTLAHGPSTTAKLNSAVVIRQDPKTGEKTEIKAPLKKLLARKQDDIPLQAGDMLYVPDSLTKRALYKGAEAAVLVTSGALIYHLE